jgi:hypothetical protein
MKHHVEFIATTISFRSFRRFQFGVVTLLVLLGLFHYLYIGYLGRDTITNITVLFDLGKENSIPTAFSIINLLISSVLLYFVYCVSKYRGDRVAFYWFALCILFVLLTIDEAASIHERAGALDRFTGIVLPLPSEHRWVLYGGIFAGAVFLFFLPFLLSIPRTTAWLLVLSGAIFIGGALGFEILGSWMLQSEFASREDLIYDIRRVGEEGLEMYAIALFNCTLFGYLVPATIGWRFSAASK